MNGTTTIAEFREAVLDPAKRRHYQLAWLSTVDHKRIAVLYMLTALVFFIIGGTEALFIRLQLDDGCAFLRGARRGRGRRSRSHDERSGRQHGDGQRSSRSEHEGVRHLRGGGLERRVVPVKHVLSAVDARAR